MKLKDSNIGYIFLTTGFPESRSRFYKKVIENDNENFNTEKAHEDDDENDANIDSDEKVVENDDNKKSDNVTEENNDAGSDGALLGIGKKPEKIFGKEGLHVESTTVHDRYAARPTSSNPEVDGKLEQLCLAQFATCYTPINKLPKDVKIGKDGYSEDEKPSFKKIFNSEVYLPKYIELLDGLGFMRLRSYPIVLRIHNSKKKEGHEQHYSELLLFAHWRDEVVEFHRHSSDDCVAEYESRKEEVSLNRKKCSLEKTLLS